jgi:hypothetical protein
VRDIEFYYLNAGGGLYMLAVERVPIIKVASVIVSVGDDVKVRGKVGANNS